MAFRVRDHPRVNNKPLKCKSGIHTWETSIVGGRPLLSCKKCGAIIFKEVHDKTYEVGKEPQRFDLHNSLIEQRRSLLRKTIVDALRIDRK